MVVCMGVKIKVEPYPICPRCEMEALSLGPSGEDCSWCRGGTPMTRERWDALMLNIAENKRKIEAKVVLDLIKRTIHLSDSEYKEILKGINDGKKKR